MSSKFQEMYQKVLKPNSIVVIGASNSLNKPGGSIVKNIVDHNYSGKLSPCQQRRRSNLRSTVVKRCSGTAGQY